MSTRASLLPLIRPELADAGGTQSWTGVLQNQWINATIRACSRKLLKEMSTTIVAAAGQASCPRPTSCHQEARGMQPNRVRGISGERRNRGDRSSGGQVVQAPAPGAGGSDQGLPREARGWYAEPTADGNAIASPPVVSHWRIGLGCASVRRWTGLDEAMALRFKRPRGASVGAWTTAHRGPRSVRCGAGGLALSLLASGLCSVAYPRANGEPEPGALNWCAFHLPLPGLGAVAPAPGSLVVAR